MIKIAKNDEVRVKFSVFNQDYNKAMGEMRDETKKLTKEFQLEQEQLKENGTETDKLKSKLEFLNKSHELSKQAVQATEEQLKKAKDLYGENSKEVETLENKLINAQLAEQKLANNVNEATKSLADKENKLKQLGEKLTETSEKVDKFGEKTKDIGEGLSKGITAPIAAVATASMAAFTEVDEGLDTIITKTGLTGEAYDSLEESFKKVYGNMPVSAEEAGIAIGELNTRFQLTGEELEGLSETFLQFANINGTDLNESIGKTQKIMSQWNIETDRAGYLLDFLTNESQYTGVSIDSLMDSVQQNGATFKQMGFTLEDSIVLLSEFEKNGVNSETAMAALKKATVNFTKEGKSTSQGLKETVKSIKNAKSETEALTIATKVFGPKGAAEMATAIREGRLEVDKMGIDMEELSGVVSDTFEATQDPPDELKKALNNLNLGLSDLASTIMSVAAPAIQWVGDTAKKVTEWFNGLSEGTKRLIVIIGGIAAAIGPLLMIIGTLAGSISKIIVLAGNISTALGGTGAAAGAASSGAAGLGATLGSLIAPILAIIAAIAAFILIFKKLYEDNEQFRELVNNAWNAIKTTITNAINIVSTFIKDIFGGLLAWWRQNQESIKQAGQTVWQFIQNKIMAVINFLVPFIKTAWDIIKNTISIVWFSISSVIRIALELIKGIIMVAVNAINGNWSAVWNTIKNTVINIWNIIKGFISNVLGSIKNIIVSIFTNIVSAVVNKAAAIKNAIVNGFNSAMDFLASLPGKMLGYGKNIVDGLIDGIKSKIAAVGNAVANIANTVKNKITGLLGIHSPSRVMMEAGGYTGEGFVLGIKDKIKSVKKAAQQIGETVTDIVGGMPSLGGEFAFAGVSGEAITNYANTSTSNQFNIQATVRSDDDIDKLVDEIDRRLGDKL